MGNQYEADYQRLREFADTTINQIDSSVSHTVGCYRVTKKRDKKLTAKRLEYQLSLLHEKNDGLKQDWPERLLLLRICFIGARISSQLRKRQLSMTTCFN